MNIHEYQAKELLKAEGVPVLYGRPIMSPDEAGRIAYHEFVMKGISTVVLKCQIHAGGRGKGFVVDAESREKVMRYGKPVRGVTVIGDGNIADKAFNYALSTFGNVLVTVQTGEQGKTVNRMFIEQGCDIAKEYYLSILLDRQTGKNLIMVSTEGGMDIEAVAEHSPEKILKQYIDPTIGFRQYQARSLAFGLSLQGKAFKSFCSFIEKIVAAYDKLDCSLLEVNPLVLTKQDEFIALDAKINFDDNSLFRHPNYAQLRDLAEEDPLEVEASKYDLNYIKLDGNVGCMVNGAGLAMATMDLIKLHGGDPANFLDVGGGATKERVCEAFKIILSDKNVKGVLVNIFGGIVRCDLIAEGILGAVAEVGITIPVVVRLEGNRAQEASEVFKKSSLNIIAANDLTQAAKTIVDAVKVAK